MHKLNNEMMHNIINLKLIIVTQNRLKNKIQFNYII